MLSIYTASLVEPHNWTPNCVSIAGSNFPDESTKSEKGSSTVIHCPVTTGVIVEIPGPGVETIWKTAWVIPVVA